RHIKARGPTPKPPRRPDARPGTPSGQGPASPRFYTIRDLCLTYGAHRTYWSKQIREGKLAARKIGKSYRVTPGALEAFLASRPPGHPRPASGEGPPSSDRGGARRTEGGDEGGR